MFDLLFNKLIKGSIEYNFLKEEVRSNLILEDTEGRIIFKWFIENAIGNDYFFTIYKKIEIE